VADNAWTMTASCDRGDDGSRVGRDWSHDALRAPWWEGCPEVQAGDPDELKRQAALPSAVYLAYVDPELSPTCNLEEDEPLGLVSFGRPTRESLARWLANQSGPARAAAAESALEAILLLPRVAEQARAASSDERTRCRGKEESERFVRLLADFDRAHHLLSDPAYAQRMSTARRERRQRNILVAERYIRTQLDAGLEWRFDTRLERAEVRTFVQLAARLSVPRAARGSLQVCEGCDLVFRVAQSNARRCANCRKRPGAKIFPKSRGGHHTGTYGNQWDGTLRYFFDCTSCGTAASASHPNTHLCPVGCGSNSGRQRRRRSQAPDPTSLAGGRCDGVRLAC
jgi:hypothetical protein